MPLKRFGLLGLIVLPVLVAAGGMLWSSATMLKGIAQSVDQQEAERSWHAIKSALGAAQERLSGTITDNAKWDDAATHAYGPIDQDWIYNTWGVGTSDVNYDTMYIVDNLGRSIISYQNGQLSTLPATDYYGEALQKITDDLPKDSSTFEAVSTLVMTPQGLSIMAAGPILPTSEEIKIPTERPNVLVFSKLVSDDMLAAISKQYIVDGIGLAPVTQLAEASNILLDRWGRILSAVTWQARHPGMAASAAYQGNALESLLAIIGVMLPLTLAYARSVNAAGRAEVSARFAAQHDALSGLHNRAFLIEELSSKLATARPFELALVFVDLDGFKAVNDAYDHETGDKLIRTVAGRLSSLTAGQCTLARLGGDEFAILIKGAQSIERAQALAQQVLAELRKPVDIDGRLALIGASIGIAEHGEQRLEPAEFMRMADIAMYDPKNAGGNQMRLFDSALDEKRSEEIAIANEMRAFIAQGVFDIAYQPMVDSRSRAMIGVEALARWPKSSDRRLAPDRFIGIAEEHGLINDLGSLILRMACRDMAQRPGLKLAVNISALQANDPGLVSNIVHIAGEMEFPLNRLEIEFTETALIRNEQRAAEVITQLKSLGITVALDDFGSGYASVGYLRKYAFDKIKLDRSLTQSLSNSPDTQRVVQGTILIAKGLSAYIIAEGVETEEEARLLHLSGCHQLQGYFFGKPQPAAALIAQFNHQTDTCSSCRLDPECSLARASRSRNTLRAYTQAMSAFRDWCGTKGVESLPASPEAVASYLSHRMKQGAKAATLSVTSSAIRHWHKQAGHQSPTESQGVQDVARGIRRTIGTAQTQKKPATAERLSAMLAHVPDTMHGKRDRALILLGFAGAFRRSELAGLELADVAFTEQGMDVLLRFSKTDQEGAGQSVAIPHGQSLLPVKAVQEWIAAAGITEGPLFRSVGKSGKVSGNALVSEDIARAVKRYAKAAGLDVADFSGHSLRAGFVTSAAERNADINRIMDQTRHTDPRTVRKYIRRAERYRDHAGAGFL